MVDLIQRVKDRVTPHLPGWLLLICGMTVINLTILIPTWLEARKLNWQRRVMQLQVEHIEKQNERYQLFDQGLAYDDPVLLERLAFTHLRMKPAGATLLTLAQRPTPSGEVYWTLCEYDPQHPPDQAQPPSRSIDAWLYTPLPKPGVDYQPLSSVRSRLARIATGSLRMGLAAFGVICLVGGLTPPSAK